MGGSHFIQIPSSPAWASVTDEFSYADAPWEDLFSRRNGLTFSPSPLFTLTAEGSASYTGGAEQLNQIWKASLASQAEELFHCSIQTQWELSSREWEWTPSSYPEGWLRGYLLLLPTEEGIPLQRKGSAQFAVSLSPSWGSPRFTLESLYFNNLQGESPDQTSRTTGKIEVPLSFGDGPDAWQVTPAYSRKVKTTGPSASENFEEDLVLFGENFPALSLMGRSIPFAELYAMSLREEFLSAYSEAGADALNLSPHWSLAFSRPTGSYLKNLLIPVDWELSQTRILEKEGDVLQDGRETSLTARFSAINLFGKQGAYPFFSFYQTEELISLVTYTLVEDLIADDVQKHQMILQHYLFLKGDSRNTLEGNNYLSLSGGDSSDWSERMDLSWIHRASVPEIPLPAMIRQDILQGAVLKHIETMEAEWGEEKNLFSLSFLISHETALEFTAGRVGFFSLWGRNAKAGGTRR